MIQFFSFLAGQYNSFPTLPTPSLMKCMNVWVFFFLLLTPILLCCDVDRIVNKVLLHCLVADKWHSLCEKHFCFKCCHPGNEHRRNSQSSLGKWEQVHGIREPPSCLILYVIFFSSHQERHTGSKANRKEFSKKK